jgi:exodeoxyribonuclease-5
LSAQPLVAAALALLRLVAQRYQIAQQDISSLLASPYWSAAVNEADARARLDAVMRRKLGATLHLDQVLKLARAQSGLPALVRHLEALAVAWPRRLLASAWSTAFAELLSNAGWPGERSLSSHEFQARQAWGEALADFAGLDGLLPEMTAGEAVQRLARLCRERIYQPEAVGEPRLQVMGMLEAQSAPLDAVWVMGMNDHVWPPPARPNPLLPAEAQRRAGAPNSCSSVQAEFAQAIHARLLHSAPEIVFSWARKEGERELRMSPLLVDIPEISQPVAPAATLAEQLAQPLEMEWLDDHRAPPVAEGEKVAGGSSLLKAQAICPAWAYYRYRLGARALEEPVEGLDSMDRGTLLHAVLQCFWHGRGSVDLSAMDEAALKIAVDDAIERGIRQFCTAEDKTLPPHFLTLERQRLHFLLIAWLGLEKSRGHFTVQECERRVSLNIEGIAVELTLDRIDELEDGRLVVIDYKTGTVISHKSWADSRITEPQLPIYAALALADGNVAAVCFAKVHVVEQKFIGLAHLPDTLPGVDCLDDARKLFSEEAFPDWPSVLAHWKTCITAIAREIREGEAAVRFTDESDLAFCEVKPLLRLPERKLQYERGAAGHE